MIRITKKEVNPADEVIKPLCGHVIYDEPEYSMQNPLVRLVMASMLLLVLAFTSIFVRYEIFLYFFAYILIGAEIFAKGIVSIAKRRIDENILMLILTLIAFSINRQDEALLILLFYGFAHLWQQAETNISRTKLNTFFADKESEKTKNYTEICENIKQASMKKVENVSFLSKCAFYYTNALLLVVVFAFILLLILGLGLEKAFTLMAICMLLGAPFSLLFALPASFALAVRAARKHDIFVKNSNFIEELTTVDLLVFDTAEHLSPDLIATIKSLGVKKCLVLNPYHTMREEEAAALGIDLILTQDNIDTGRQIAALDKLMREGNVRKVAFVGVNPESAPIAASADVSIAFYSEGAELLAQASDIVFLESSINKLSKLFVLARKTRVINKENIAFAILVRSTVIALLYMDMLTLWESILIEICVACIASLNTTRLIFLKK